MRKGNVFRQVINANRGVADDLGDDLSSVLAAEEGKAPSPEADSEVVSGNTEITKTTDESPQVLDGTPFYTSEALSVQKGIDIDSQKSEITSVQNDGGVTTHKFVLSRTGNSESVNLSLLENIRLDHDIPPIPRPSPKMGRPPGKSSNPGFLQITALVRIETSEDLDEQLLFLNKARRRGGQKLVDRSQIIDLLISDWVSQQKTEREKGT